MKYKVKVERVYYKEVIVDADDYNHAVEIGSEVDDTMDLDHSTYQESNWDAELVSENEVATYVPEQDYLK